MNTQTEKRQKSPVGVAGNFINQMMANNSSLPEVGKGATELHYTDRSCYEVIEVSADGREVKLESLTARFDPAFGKPQMGHQNWILEPTGNFKTVIWRNNAWRTKVRSIVFTDEIQKKATEAGYYAAPMFLYKTDPELHEKIFAGQTFPQTIVEGITREKFEYPAIKLLFGVKDYRYDWEF